MIAAICLGFFGAIFALVGMKCTKIGGSDQNKARIAFLSGVNFILSGEYCEIRVYNQCIKMVHLSTDLICCCRSLLFVCMFQIGRASCRERV